MKALPTSNNNSDNNTSVKCLHCKDTGLVATFPDASGLTQITNTMCSFDEARFHQGEIRRLLIQFGSHQNFVHFSLQKGKSHEEIKSIIEIARSRIQPTACTHNTTGIL